MEKIKILPYVLFNICQNKRNIPWFLDWVWISFLVEQRQNSCKSVHAVNLLQPSSPGWRWSPSCLVQGIPWHLNLGYPKWLQGQPTSDMGLHVALGLAEVCWILSWNQEWVPVWKTRVEFDSPLSSVFGIFNRTQTNSNSTQFFSGI